MTWEEQLFALFDDLEQQAEGAFGVEREAEIADLGQSEYAQVTLASRLMASLDRAVALEVQGVGLLRGKLERAHADWCLLGGTTQPATGQEWLVRLPAVVLADGLSERSVPEAAWSPVARLGFGSALRRIAGERRECTLHLSDGTRHEAEPWRVGADFVEARIGSSRVAVIAFSAIAAVARRD